MPKAPKTTTLSKTTTISLQYLKENVKDGVHFFLLIIIQSDTVIFDVCG